MYLRIHSRLCVRNRYLNPPRAIRSARTPAAALPIAPRALGRVDVIPIDPRLNYPDESSLSRRRRQKRHGAWRNVKSEEENLVTPRTPSAAVVWRQSPTGWKKLIWRIDKRMYTCRASTRNSDAYVGSCDDEQYRLTTPYTLCRCTDAKRGAPTVLNVFYWLSIVVSLSPDHTWQNYTCPEKKVGVSNLYKAEIFRFMLYLHL